ncbi:hypothetical protein NUM_34710 [Actinocatenispora comari]|uniref:Uncharacterized protein n=1 Tax=Actinocatenispora comari TaxID=2807577 RepID=A0A8J4AFI1_9ACTN|nr:hypothetical protein NUM_34710 [Actinocatenispora comari]
MNGFTYCVSGSSPCCLPCCCGAAPAGWSTPSTSAAPATTAPHRTPTRNLRTPIALSINYGRDDNAVIRGSP